MRYLYIMHDAGHVLAQGKCRCSTEEHAKACFDCSAHGLSKALLQAPCFILGKQHGQNGMQEAAEDRQQMHLPMLGFHWNLT
jgi:hypothetical protein